MVQVLDVVVGKVGDYCSGFWVFVEEMFVGICVVEGFVVLVFVVDGFYYQFFQDVVGVFGQQGILVIVLQQFDYVLVVVMEYVFQFLDDFVVVVYWVVQVLQVVVYYEDQVVQVFMVGQGDGIQGFWFVVFVVVDEVLYFVVGFFDQVMVFQVVYELCLVDGGQWVQVY